MKSSVLSTCSFCLSYSACARSMPRGALDDVLVVAKRVARQLAVLQLDDLVADRADEGAIVRDQHERPLVLGEVGLEPLDGGEIEVVGRLVHQEEIGLSHQHLGQLQPAALAARQRVDRAGEIALGEADVGREPLDPTFELVAAAALVALLELAVPGELVGLSVRQARLQRRHLVVQLLQIGERLEQCLEQRAAAPQLLRLAQVGDRRAPEHAHVAAVGLEVSGQEAQRRRLAGAVRSEQRQPVARTDQEGGADEDVVAGITEAGVSELGEGHRWICWSSCIRTRAAATPQRRPKGTIEAS